MSARAIVLMGVTGAGKTTVGRLLARRLGVRFLEGDAYHPPANIAKMRAGVPLDDADRWPWLEAILRDLRCALDRGETVVLACSALKRAYRDFLRRAGAGVVFVHLAGPEPVIAERLARRRHEYMPPSLLPSQFAALEDPSGEPDVITVAITLPPEAIVEEIASRFGGSPVRAG
ncbi:MAG: gluconokinase [Geminicoccaceae bacterium]|nr:gluconokinase [Geminicoccaceae bacterium]